MNRVLIFGNSGSGKSTLANTLSKKLAIPAYHMDELCLADDWSRHPEENVIPHLRKILDQEK